MAVNELLAPLYRGMAKEKKARYYTFWFVFFLAMIAVVGGLFAYCVTVPLCLVGRFFTPFWNIGGEVLVIGVGFLLDLEPWLNADVSIELPGAPFVTVSNHRSHLDMFFLLSHIPNVRVIAKRSLFYVPFLGIMMWVLKNIPVKKGDVSSYLRALERAKEALDEGDPVHIFPEGTRCEPGFEGVQEFQLAPFRMIMDTGLPLIPIVFVDTDKVWPKGLNKISFRQKATVVSLPVIHPQDFPNAESLRAYTHEQIQNRLLENR